MYTVVKAVFDNFDQFRKLHPAFANLKEQEMIRDSLSAPLHAGGGEVLQGAGLDVGRTGGGRSGRRPSAASIGRMRFGLAPARSVEAAGRRIEPAGFQPVVMEPP